MKKGSTLIEVVVACALFGIVMVIAASTYVYVSRVKQKEIEYIEFETICLDINHYYSKYGSSWQEKYFVQPGSPVYYDGDFNVTYLEEDYKYLLEYTYNSNNELIINVKRNDENHSLIIENLNYGGSRNVEK